LQSQKHEKFRCLVTKLWVRISTISISRFIGNIKIYLFESFNKMIF
jgi:hypothetical protein